MIWYLTDSQANPVYVSKCTGSTEVEQCSAVFLYFSLTHTHITGNRLKQTSSISEKKKVFVSQKIQIEHEDRYLGSTCRSICIQAAKKQKELNIWKLLSSNSTVSCKKRTKKTTFESNSQGERGESPLKQSDPVLPSFWLQSSSPSSAHLAQPVVCLWVGDDGLHGHDGLVDLGLQLPQLLYVQQAQDLSRFVQSGV